jgi:hypothetical protein
MGDSFCRLNVDEYRVVPLDFLNHCYIIVMDIDYINGIVMFYHLLLEQLQQNTIHNAARGDIF